MKSLTLLLPLMFVWNAHGAIDPLIDAGDRKQIGSEVLARALASSDPQERVRAAFILGRMQDTRGLDPLLKLLKDPSAKVREAAAFNVGQYGWRTVIGREPEMQTALLPLTTDTDAGARKAAVEALGKVGLESTPELVLPYLNDKSSEIRALAAMALSRYRMVLKLRAPDKEPAALPEPAMSALLKLRADRSADVRRAVAYYFVRTADARGEAALAELTRDRDEWVKFYALTGLGKLKAKNSKRELTRALSEPKYYLRVAALNALIAGEFKVADQRRLMRDDSWHVRAAFARALDAKAASEAADLKRMLKRDASPTVKTEALKALAKDPAFQRELLKYLKDPAWQLREAALQSHAALPEADREALLAAGLADEHKLVRVAALEGLAAIPTPSAFAQLKTALRSEELTMRGAAVGGLSERKEPEVLELAWKTYGESMDPRWVELRQEIVGVVAKSSSSTAGKYLRQAVKDPDPSVGVKAMQALVERGEKDLPSPALSTQLSFTPHRDLTFSKNPRLKFETNKGSFVVEAFAKEAPVHVANLVGQARAGLYDGLTWHRVVSNFVIQGGDPDGSGWGDAGYSMRWEVNRVPFRRGTLGMPRSSGFDTGGVQLFFDHVPTPHLDGLYTVFGQIVEGVSVVDRIERGDRIVKVRVLN